MKRKTTKPNAAAKIAESQPAPTRPEITFTITGTRAALHYGNGAALGLLEEVTDRLREHFDVKCEVTFPPTGCRIG